MNFEEMLNSREGAAIHREKMPIGEFYKKQVDGKYINVVELFPALTDSIVFCEALKADQVWTQRHHDKQQLHFDLHGDSNGLCEMEIESGVYQTLAGALNQNPALVAEGNFVDTVFDALVTYLSKMHGEGVWQLCLAPQNILVRKGSNMPLLLTHGSFYQSMADPNDLYGDYKDFMAPEVMAHGTVDGRSDVYTLGRLIEFLYAQGSMPLEYKGVVKKATAENPDHRYKTLDEMKRARDSRRNAKRSVIMLAAALAITLIAVLVYIDLIPDTPDFEYVEPVQQTAASDSLSDPFDQELELLMQGDTIALTDEDRLYMQKAEEIFRKRYAEEADRILSEIYDNDRMNASEKKFTAGSKEMVEKLINLQATMGSEAGLTESQASRIGQEIVDKITLEKQRNLTRNGYIRPEED